MKTATSIAALIAGAGLATALPQPHSSRNSTALAERGGEVGDGIVGLAMLIAELIQDNHNAYDTDIPNNCVISTSTFAGSDCSAQIACGEEIGAGQFKPFELRPGPGLSTDTWNVCYLNGEQFFHDDRVGDFSITYTQAGGVNSDRDGLHHAVYKFAEINNWEPIDAQADADKDEDSGHICSTSEVAGTQTIDYSCGVPEIGYSNFGLTNTPPMETSYAPGQCGIHWIQYQIPDGGDHYSLAIRVVDANGALIGQVGNSYEVGGANVDASDPVNLDSALPYVVVSTVVKPGSFDDTDDQPVHFAYADQSWDSSSAQCSTGAYDSGSRQGDCGFSC